MNLNEIMSLDEQYYINSFGKRTPVCFTHGKGIKLYSTEGKEYTDFFAGIAVNALGYGNEKVVKAVQDQAAKLLHCSNLYYIESQAKLAKTLCDISCADKVFVCNSGGEANEAAIKLARIYYKKKGFTEKTDFICLDKSFHGRTLTTATATGQDKYKLPYAPLTPGFYHVPINDFEAIEALASASKTCGIIVEPVQGESGVHPLDKEYAAKLRKLCDEKDILLIFDEVQTGIGRTGEMFAYKNLGVEPDIFTLAKALGGGVPIGCMCAKDFVACGFAPGDHGSTFGGNPLACSAANAVLSEMTEKNIPAHAKEMGEYFNSKIESLSLECPGVISQIRQAGLMIGIEFTKEIAPLVKGKLFDKGWLVGSVGANTLRVLPPLVIECKDIDEFIEALKLTLTEV